MVERLARSAASTTLPKPFGLAAMVGVVRGLLEARDRTGVTVDPIPREIEQFLDANIESIDQLEVLRVLSEDPGREWTAAELAAAVQAAPEPLAAHLAALLGRGLLSTAARGEATVWRHGAQTPELAEKVGRLLRVYRERPVTLIRLVYAQAASPLRAFADAFRIRKEG